MLAFSVGAAMPDFGENLARDADYVFGPSMWEPELNTRDNQEFVRTYTEMFNREPDYHSASGYSACQVLEAAVIAVGAIDNQRIRDWLSQAEMETVMPGKYKVEITWTKKTGKKVPAPGDPGNQIDETVQVIPQEYNKHTTLTAEVKAERNKIDFTLPK